MVFIVVRFPFKPVEESVFRQWGGVDGARIAASNMTTSVCPALQRRFGPSPTPWETEISRNELRP